MRRGNLTVLTLLAFGVAVASVACGSSEESGACNGTEDGTYFQLQQDNFLPEAPLEVRVNGRFVGNVAAATVNSGTGEVVPGMSLLGEFPICSGTVIDARGTGITTTRVCANNILTSTKCRQERADYCWEVFAIVEDVNNPPGQQPDTKSPYCADKTLYPDCDNAFGPC